MTVIGREELKLAHKGLIALIQMKHVMEDNIERELFIENKPVKGLCHTRGYFVIMDEFFIQYEMDHIIVDPNLMLIGRSLREVIFYDDFQEYEAARVKAMSKSKDQTGINFN
jgi:hypothetical protein